MLRLWLLALAFALLVLAVLGWALAAIRWPARRLIEALESEPQSEPASA